MWGSAGRVAGAEDPQTPGGRAYAGCLVAAAGSEADFLIYLFLYSDT